MAAGLRVLGIFPHPDDEAYACGGALARVAAEGGMAHVVCATRGEGGVDHRPQQAAGSDLGSVRVAELAESCAILGVQPPRLLNLPDGGLGEVDFAAAAGEIVVAIRELRPHLVLTLGADGVYGHPDHLALHRLLIAAFGAAGGGDRFPQERFGPAWAPLRLWCAAFPRGMFRAQYDRMQLSGHETAMRGVDPDKLGVEPADVGAAIDIRPYAAAKLAAIGAHRSQLPGGDPRRLFPDEIVRGLLTTELYTLAAGQPVSGRVHALDEGLTLGE